MVVQNSIFFYHLAKKNISSLQKLRNVLKWTFQCMRFFVAILIFWVMVNFVFYRRSAFRTVTNSKMFNVWRRGVPPPNPLLAHRKIFCQQWNLFVNFGIIFVLRKKNYCQQWNHYFQEWNSIFPEWNWFNNI